VDHELPDFMSEINKVDEMDYRLNAALFRDYSMLSSAYLLEECHLNYLKTKNYGIGMDYLPEKLAVPLKHLANRINYGQPLLEYAYGYALNNWKLVNDPKPESADYKNEDIWSNPEKPLENLQLIRKFNGCADEHGFVLLHVVIDSLTNKQSGAHTMMFEGAAKKDRALLNAGIQQHLDTLNTMNDIFAKMWNVSTPTKYLNFRTFIMGVKGNDDIFPNGVLYKGVSSEPLRYRGETGA
jgi:indoleamine 2,3-dioxygenase